MSNLYHLIKKLASPTLKWVSVAGIVLVAQSQPLRLEQPQVLADGRLRFRVTGPVGPKGVDFSNDLKVWGSLGSAVDSNAFTVVTAPSASDEPRFFRARLLGDPNGDFSAGAIGVQSTEIKLSWSPSDGAAATRIYLAAEPQAAAAEGPARRLVAVLPGGASELTVTNLAAALDYFFRIEMDTPQGTKSALVPVRTALPPRTTPAATVVLRPALREVQGFAPNILCVTLCNWPTNSIQTNWAVLRPDGTPIPITAVYRQSVPAGAPEYGLGENIGGPEVAPIETDHRMFLVFGEAIGSPSILDVSGPDGLQFVLPFSDRYLETPVIQLNQVGYNPRATVRYAYVSGWMGDGGPLSLASFPTSAEILLEPAEPANPRTTILSGLQLNRQPGIDPDSGTEVADIDLAQLPASETNHYRLRVPGVGVSYRTEISERAAFKAFFTVVRGLLHNRWGGDLKPQVTEWSRPADHTQPVFTADSLAWDENTGFPNQQSDPKNGPRVLQGGHHDAGDFDIRPAHSKVAQLLMRAYELTPESFPDGQLLLPEDYPILDGVPDLLDEALWSIRAWEQLQEDDGGVRLGVESYENAVGAFLASDDLLTYWTYGREANHTARVAGLFAQASRLVAPFSQARGAELQDRAERAFNYAAAHNADPEALIYGASELSRLTGEANYLEAFLSAWDALDIAYPGHRYGTIQNQAWNQFDLDDFEPREDPSIPRRVPMDYVLGLLTSPPPDWQAGTPEHDILDATTDDLASQAHNIAQETLTKPGHRNPRPLSYAIAWGTGTVTERYLDLVYARLQMGSLAADERQLLFNSLSLCADYVLGGNPNGLVYFTGLGSRNVQQPLHIDSLAFLQLHPELGPIPGIPAFGPYGSEDRHGYDNSSWDAFYPRFEQFPPARRYGDVRLLVAQAEFSVWECQAPHAEMFAALMSGTKGTLPPSSYRPGGVNHRNPLP